jgi:hypothetical protein
MSWESKQVNKKPLVARAERPEEPKSKPGRLFLVAGVVLAILIGGVAAFARAPQFLISDIEVSGTRALDVQFVRDTARAGIDGVWLGFIPRSHILFLQKRAWQQALVHEIPALERVDIVFDGTIARVSITEREGEYIWCADSNSEIVGDCAFLDANGMRYEIAPRYSRGVFLTFYGGAITPMAESIRAQLLTPQEFKAIVDTVRALRDGKIAVDQVVLETDGDITYGFQSAHGAVIPFGAVIHTVPGITASDVVTRTGLAFQEPGFVRSFGEVPAELRMIDVRFPGSITYRFGSTAPSSLEEATSETPATPL